MYTVFCKEQELPALRGVYCIYLHWPTYALEKENAATISYSEAELGVAVEREQLDSE